MYGGPVRVDEHALFSQNTFQKSNKAIHAERETGSWLEPRPVPHRRSFSSARKVIRPKPPPGFAMLEKECLPHRLGFVMVDLHGAILSHAVSFTTRLRYEKSRRILKHVLKPWPNGLASRRKFWTCVQLAFRLATHLRRLTLTCVDLRRLGSPFGQGL